MNVRYRVGLSQSERAELMQLMSGGKQAARKLKRAQILLAADAGVSDEDIALSVGVGGATIYRTKRRFVEGNLKRALVRGQPDQLIRQQFPRPTGAARRPAPAPGRHPHSFLLAGELALRTRTRLFAQRVSRETVRRRLAENDLKPWRRDMWCIPQVDAGYVARMEDVLDLYAEAPDPKLPVVCFDESPIQLIAEVRQPVPAAPGQIHGYAREYR